MSKEAVAAFRELKPGAPLNLETLEEMNQSVLLKTSRQSILFETSRLTTPFRDNTPSKEVYTWLYPHAKLQTVLFIRLKWG